MPHTVATFDEKNSEYLDTPLGEEDASKRKDVGAVFVDVRQLIRQPNLETNDIASIKIVVGKKGSGKTHILRYIEERARATRDVVFCALDDNAIPIRLERQFTKHLDRPTSRARWSKFWRAVIAFSIVTRFVLQKASSEARRAVAQFNHNHVFVPVEIPARNWNVHRQAICQHFQEHLPKAVPFSFAQPRGFLNPGEIMPLLLEGISSIEAFENLVDSIDTTILEMDVSTLVRAVKPLQIIIDGVDDVSWRQPRMWLDFQVGLFDAVFFYSQAQRHSDRINITIAIRNFVFLSAAESPHIDRVKHLLSLNWSPESALAFLNRRLRQVAGAPFPDSELLIGETPLRNWLGFDTVVAKRRGKEEYVEDYVLRHTRLSPRNLIRVFNMLSQEKSRQSFLGKSFGPENFQLEVDNVAHEVADLMLKTASEEVIAFVGEISSTVPVARTEGVVLWVSQELSAAIARAGREVLEWAGYRSFLVDFLLAILPGRVDVESKRFDQQLQIVEKILWRSNVIAFWGARGFDQGWVFSWSPRESHNPAPNSRVGFHSALIGRCNLEVCEDGPVF